MSYSWGGSGKEPEEEPSMSAEEMRDRVEESEEMPRGQFSARDMVERAVPRVWRFRRGG